MAKEKLVIFGCGDVVPDFPEPEKLFELVLPTMKKADIRFGQLEGNLSEKGESQAWVPGKARGINPAKASALRYAGFDILSFASNHHLDRGEMAFLETLETLGKNGIRPVGVGKNIEEARRPVIFDKKGAKVGFLGYCSVLPKGYDAGPNKPGCAPMRATTFYEQVDWQPGTPARIVTFANKEDLAALVDDVKKVRSQVDVLIMSIHWGVHHVPEVIAMYQKEVGHAAIDAGVDLILGHHAHILKGTEVYKGKVIFYSLCNFAMPSIKGRASYGKAFYGVKESDDYPYYTFQFDARKSAIAKIDIEDKKISKVSFLPLYMTGLAQPEPLQPQDKRFGEVVDYMKKVTESQDLNAKYVVEGDEVEITQ